MKIFILLIIISISVQAKYHKHKHLEKWYQQKCSKTLNGIQEYRIKGVRIDILTKDYAIEVDFAQKSYEGLGQSLYYSIISNKKPGLILIVENHRIDLKYVLRAKRVCIKYKIALWVYENKKLRRIVK